MFEWITQNKPIFWNTIFMTKIVMNFSIFWLSNKQPIIFPKLMHNIPTASGTSSLSMVSSYIIIILNIGNNFNNNFKFSAGHSILSDACNTIPWKGYNFISSIINFGKMLGYCANQFIFYLMNVFLFVKFI